MGEDTEDDVISEFPFSPGDGEEEAFVCSDCGEEFDTERGMNIHIGQVHSE